MSKNGMREFMKIKNLNFIPPHTQRQTLCESEKTIKSIECEYNFRETA